MSLVVFTGPTLSAEDGRRELDAIYLPPAAQGDVHRAALDRPAAIGIIDGYFERVPAVWHKEILWAMSQGIHVYGSASMGALRAAELAAFGMEGVGEIFEAFRRGELDDDDEVAVVHASEDDGYRPLSDAMVNIRSTLRLAEARGVLGSGDRAAMEGVAKGTFYAERSWATLLAAAAGAGLPEGAIVALRAFLPEGRVNQKREDALAMLRRMRDHVRAGIEPKRVEYAFEHTDTWEELRRRSARLRREDTLAPETEMVSADALLDELRLAGLFRVARQGAIVRHLALEQAREEERSLPLQAVQDTLDDFRRERGLAGRRDFDRWLRREHLPAADVPRFFQDEANVRWFETMFEPEATRSLPDYLRATGDYGAFMERAHAKQRLLVERGLDNPSLADVGRSEADLWAWYFERLGGRPPQDLLGHARAVGFADVDSLRRAVLRELVYVQRRP
jgi:hypothetical protein